MTDLGLGLFGEGEKEELGSITIPDDNLARRNSNPGNLRFVGQAGASEGEGGFAKFEDLDAGFEALNKQISLDAGRGHTVDSFINKYAPPNENDTQAYIKFITDKTGVDPTSKVSAVDQNKLARAMAEFESGSTFQQTQETSPIALDTFSSQEKSLPLNLFGTQQNQETRRSTVERPVDVSDTDDKGFEFVDPFIKTPLALGYGMASWPFAQAARFGAMGGQKAQQALGIVPEMSDEEITTLGNQTAEWFSTLGGALDPKSDIGKTAMEYAGKAVEPITMTAHWINSGIDREEYPHLGPLADTITEGMMFAFLHKFGKESIDIGKRQLKIRGKKGQAKIRAQKKLEKKQVEVLKKAEEAAKTGELQKTIAEYQEAIIPIAKEQSSGQPPSGQGIRTRAERAQAEILARQERSPEQQPGRVAREAERFQKGMIPDKRSLSEQSQQGRGVVGEVRKPDLGREPQSGLPDLAQPKPTPKPEVTFLSDGGIPRAKYQIENGKIKEVEKIGAKTTHQIDPKTGKSEVVERIPAAKSVYQILLEPLRNESGAITIPKSRKKLLQETTPAFRENVRKFGELAKTAGIPFKEFLKNNDFTKKEIKQMIKVSEAVKLDRPMASAKEMPKTGAKDFKITELEKGDTQVNVGKDANSNIKLGLKDLEKFVKIPRLKSGGLVQGLTVPETFFTKHKSLKPLLNMKRSRDKALVKDTKVLTKAFKEIEKTYSNKKLRKEAGALQISKGKFGEKAMQKMRVKINPDAKYQGLNTELQPILQDGLRRMNEVRKMNGRKPIKEMEDFISWFAEENLWRDVKELVGGDFNRQGPSLIHDSIETIKYRHSQPALDMGNFNHVTREGLRDGVKLELDPLVIAQRYMSELLPVIHYAELNSFIKEAMTKDLTLPNGKKINFSDKYTGINQGLAQELISWSNSLVGKSNSPLPHLVEKQLGRLRRSLTNATLVGNIRTTAIQLTALQTSFVERPGRTVQAGFDFMADLGRKKPKFDRDKFNSLPEKGSGLSTMDTSFSDATSAIGGTKLQKAGVLTKNTLAWAMKQLDYVAREITARAKESELKRAVKEGRLSEKEMIEQVDSAVVRTQSSGARGEVSPIQRSELGKIMTLWQTFTIGHINWLAKEVLGIKNPEMTPVKTANRVFRYVTTMAVLGYVFEDLIGIQAPGPAPIQTLKRSIEGGETDPIKIALTAGRELAELVPFGGSIKFGSSIFGPVVDFLDDVTGLAAGTDIYNKDTIAKARKGDVKSIIKILEVSGKFKGVPGTAQIAKTARGLLRDESLMRAMIGRIYDEGAGGTKGKRRKRSKRKRRSKQRRR